MKTGSDAFVLTKFVRSCRRFQPVTLEICMYLSYSNSLSYLDDTQAPTGESSSALLSLLLIYIPSYTCCTRTSSLERNIEL